MVTKRIRHPGGMSWLTRKRNARGDWAVQVFPEGLLVDTFHTGMAAHLHDPADRNRRIPLGAIAEGDCVHRIILHLVHHGGIDVPALVEELRG